MREIKFRAKTVDEGRWVYGFGVMAVEYTDGSVSHHMYTYNGDYHVDPETIGQYIGLKDCSRKDIYEGDIVLVDDGKYSGIVKFNDEDLSFVIEDDIGGYRFVNGQTYDERPEYRTYQVIGNIHETEE